MRISDWSSDVCSSDLAAPLGMIEAGADSFAGQFPTILKVNSANSWATARDQEVTGGVDDALRLGCVAIGFTGYPRAEHFFALVEEISALSAQDKSGGLAQVSCSDRRGGGLRYG